MCAGAFWREAYLEGNVQPKKYFRVIPLMFLCYFYYFQHISIYFWSVKILLEYRLISWKYRFYGY